MAVVPPGVAATIDALDRSAVADLVREGSRLALRWYRQPPVQGLENKADSGFDPVTVADRAVEEHLRSQLRSRFPHYAILGEEFGLEGSGPWQWTIDPIDGTRAFITGQPMWGTLLGLSYEGQPLAGWMHLPVLDETYHGLSFEGGERRSTLQTGGGTSALEVLSLKVSATEELADAIVLCTHPTMFDPGEQADRFQRVAGTARMVRYSGDCVNYGLLAMGLADAVVENQLAPYDIMPLIPIVEGAGGVITDLEGNRPVSGGYVVAAGTKALHRQLLDRLSPAR